jgi:RNA polymerase sigma-70 factor, ECF subfamily
MDKLDNFSDIELVELCLNGNDDAFGEIIKRYETQILRYCNRLLNYNQQDAEDATSDTFYRAYRYIASFNNEYKFSSWLYRIAHNQSINIIRRNSKFFTVDIESFFHISAPIHENVSEISIYDLESVLAELNYKDRNILVLFYLEEKSLREIGDILKLTDNTVAQKLSRARKKAKLIIQKLNNKLNS